MKASRLAFKMGLTVKRVEWRLFDVAYVWSNILSS